MRVAEANETTKANEAVLAKQTVQTEDKKGASQMCAHVSSKRRALCRRRCDETLLLYMLENGRLAQGFFCAARLFQIAECEKDSDGPARAKGIVARLSQAPPRVKRPPRPNC